MGKASSSKKVARAARAGGGRRAGQRRNLGFPATIAGVVILGLILVLVTRQDRIANAAPRVNDDHWHVPWDVYTCVPDPATPVTPPTTTTVPADSTTTVPADSTTVPPASGQGLGLVPAGHLGATQEPTTTTTTPADSTTTTLVGETTTTLLGDTTTSTSTTVVAQPGDVPGIFQPALGNGNQADPNGIHTHGDGVIHIHPFNASAAGRNAQLKVFMDTIGVTLTDDTLAFQDPNTGELLTYKEGTTKCQGGKDGIIQVGLWDKVEDAANGQPPNQVITSNVGDVRLKNGHALTVAFLPKDSRIPIQSDVKHRFDNLTDIATTTTTAPASESSSGAEPSSGADTSTTATTLPTASSSSGG
jgi:hypothetical protein